MPTRVKTHEPHVAPGDRNRPPRSRLLAFRAADIESCVASRIFDKKFLTKHTPPRFQWEDDVTIVHIDVLPNAISTARLKLVPASEQFVHEFREYTIGNRAHLQPWEPLRAESFFETESVRRRLSMMAHNKNSGVAVHLLLIAPATGEIVGDCNFTVSAQKWTSGTV